MKLVATEIRRSRIGVLCSIRPGLQARLLMAGGILWVSGSLFHNVVGATHHESSARARENLSQFLVDTYLTAVQSSRT